MALAEHPGEILAGLETAAECDLGDACFRLILQQSRGGFQAAAREVFHRRDIDELAAKMSEMRASEAAGFRH